jgi:hypothetical protein
MFKLKAATLAAVACCTLPVCASAQDDAILEEIRREIQQLKETYDSRIQALEKRLKEAEAAAASAKGEAAAAKGEAAVAKDEATAAKGEAAAAQASAQSAGAQARQSSPSAFNPGLSLILQGSYRDLDEDPETRGITGFVPPGDLDLGDRGFNLDETELTINANIDHLFYGQATFAIADGEIEAEEAFFQTSALGHGLGIKGGRFFSSVGYFNQVHAHAWDFIDPALVQGTFLGPNFAMDAVQATWIAPLPVFLEIGGEVGKPVEFPFEDSDHSKNGFSGGTVFARIGGDIGPSSSYRVGAWYLRSANDVTEQPILDLDAQIGFENTLAGGHTRMWGLDFVYKWAPDGDPTYRNFKFVAEWMERRLDGDLTYDINSVGPVPGPIDDTFEAKQRGWYVQGVYQFHPYWRVGLRYDQLDQGSYDLGAALNGLLAPPDFTPKRYSAMIDWNPSEFSRLRLQYNQDKSQQNVTDDQIFLQYIFSLGTHGAHKF